MKLKYVLFDDLHALLAVPGVGHDEIMRPGHAPIRAGFAKFFFISRTEIGVITYSRSKSLDLESDPGDADIIKAMCDNKTLAGLMEE